MSNFTNSFDHRNLFYTKLTCGTWYKSFLYQVSKRRIRHLSHIDFRENLLIPRDPRRNDQEFRLQEITYYILIGIRRKIMIKLFRSSSARKEQRKEYSIATGGELWGKTDE